MTSCVSVCVIAVLHEKQLAIQGKKKKKQQQLASSKGWLLGNNQC